MQIVIDIDDDMYKQIMADDHVYVLDDVNIILIENAIYNGTPLPKGHGKIIDVNNLMEEMKAKRTYDIPFALERVKPIIEADKGVLEKINEKQDSLRATCKAWDEAISRDGYVD